MKMERMKHKESDHKNERERWGRTGRQIEREQLQKARGTIRPSL